MVANFTGGGAAINQICKAFDISLKVYELALEQPTGDITEGPAMDERTCAAHDGLRHGGAGLRAGSAGASAKWESATRPSAAAIYCALFGGEAEDWVGRGTGVDDVGLKRKADAVRAAVALHKPHIKDPLDALARLGGREIAAMAGAILAARHSPHSGSARWICRLFRCGGPSCDG